MAIVPEVKQAICRSCLTYCHLDVTVQDGRAMAVKGDFQAPIFEGFMCPKGRALPQMHANPSRLLHSLKRQSDGSYKPIETERAIEEIADKVSQIIDERGPEAIAAFLGGGTYEQQAGAALMPAFLRAIGSPMLFTPASIDQPGMSIARALHGQWAGGRPRPETWEVFLLIGGNPIVSKQYFGQNPGRQLKALFREQAKLIVIDPRKTETARRAHVHLQLIPGEDATLLAGLIHLIIREGWVAREFIDANTRGLDRLTQAVSRFTPDYVAARTGVDETRLLDAARILGTAHQGDIGTGTGPCMAPRGSLTCYLANCLQTLRGFWPMAGEQACKPPVLMPPRTFKAQPMAPAPAWGFGRKFRVRGLQESVVGMPLGALQDEILTPGKEQIRGLFMHGGAMMSWPGQSKTHQALRSLDLLVVPDVELSPTARVATYVIAVKMQLEMAAMTHFTEILAPGHHGYGWNDPYAAYSPALVDPPRGSDVIESWELYYGLARRLGLQLEVGNAAWLGGSTIPLDMTGSITTDDVFDAICAGSRIPLSEVRKYPHGNVFDEARETILPRDPDCEARLELADPNMIDELHVVRTESAEAKRGTDSEFPLLLIPRRVQNTTNSTHGSLRAFLRVPHNPAFMHPEVLSVQPQFVSSWAQFAQPALR